MRRSSLVFWLFLAVLLLLCPVAVSGNVVIGVKQGDWIEYKVVTTGAVPEGHDVTWARMEILSAVGTEIHVNVTTKANNGTYASNVLILNPAEGRVGVWFIIPADLNVGEAFFDASLNRSVTVEGSQVRTIAGASRTVTHATTPERIKSWDRSTGVFVESIDVLKGYTLNATAVSTNMWAAQILGLEPGAFYVLVLGVAALAIVSAVAVFANSRRRKR